MVIIVPGGHIVDLLSIRFIFFCSYQMLFCFHEVHEFFVEKYLQLLKLDKCVRVKMKFRKKNTHTFRLSVSQNIKHHAPLLHLLMLHENTDSWENLHVTEYACTESITNNPTYMQKKRHKLKVLFFPGLKGVG